jgi:phosphate transport system substrate-binding protein
LLLPASVVRAAEPAATPPGFAAQVAASIPPYRPGAPVTGVIRLWGHGNIKLPWMMNLVHLWEAGFRRFHPGIVVQYEMHGTSSAVPALYAGRGDLAILGEEILPEAVAAFTRVKGYAPTGIQLLTGSLDVRNFDYAQMFFVHADNPLSGLTLAQLDAIFGAEHRRGPANIRTWGQLGLKGEWADQPIVPYGWRIDDSFGIYLEGALLEGSHRWNGALHEYAHITQPDGTIYDHGQQILDALAKDRYGIAVSNVRYAGPAVKSLALAARAGGPYIPATKETLIDESYPLARIIPAIIDWPPGGSIDPKVREFLRYLLSREGQQAVVADGRYLPLAPAVVAAELRKLDPAAVRPLLAGESVAPPPAPEFTGPPRAGLVRIWGDPAMAAVSGRWAEGFQRLHPSARVEVHLLGTATAMPSLYLGVGELALLGRESNTTDNDGFLHVLQYRPLRFEPMTGSVDVPGKSPALAVFVGRDNPLARLTLAQLAGILGSGSPDSTAPIHSWGQLGLAGAWSDRPIHLYSFDAESGTGLFLLHRVLGDSRKMAWAHLTEFTDGTNPDGSVLPAGQRIVSALGHDPDGLAVSSVGFATPEVKTVALAERAEGPYLQPTREAIQARTYPLTRHTYAFANQPPGAPLDPTVRALLDYILSPAGQADVAQDDGFLPLGAAALMEEKARLPR